jgi:hypothetical protein
MLVSGELGEGRSVEGLRVVECMKAVLAVKEKSGSRPAFTARLHLKRVKTGQAD